MKKMIALILTIVTALSLTNVITVSAAASWPSLSSSAYCEFKAPNQINVYKDTGCTTRGTSSPSKAYNAYISKNDVCKIYKITSSYIQLNYPTSSGNRTGYIKRSDLFSVSAPTEKIISKGNATTYVTPNGASYGTVETGDTVYAYETSSGYGVVYTAKSANRAYKFGWVTKNDYTSKIKGTASTSSSSDSSWQYPVDGYNVSQTFGHNGHLGMDLTTSKSDKTIYAAADGTVVATGVNGTGTNGNGYYVVIKHTIGGKTVYSMYGHLKENSIKVKSGSSVKKGTPIATMGNTGNSTGTHVHFAIADTYKQGTYYGYTSDRSQFNSNSKKESRSQVTFYNPAYVVKNGKLP